jgi:hypothetical protein
MRTIILLVFIAICLSACSQNMPVPRSPYANAIFVNGYYQGADPDPGIRDNLRRDPRNPPAM